MAPNPQGSGWDAMVADETRTCPHCNGHGWIQTGHDPDTDIDCPTCKEYTP